MLTGKSVNHSKVLTLNELVQEVMDGNLPAGTYLTDESVGNEIEPPHEKYKTLSAPISISESGYVSSTPSAISAVNPVKDRFTITQAEEVTLDTMLDKLMVVVKNSDGTYRFTTTTNHSVGWVLRQHPANAVKSVTALDGDGELVEIYKHKP